MADLSVENGAEGKKGRGTSVRNMRSEAENGLSSGINGAENGPSEPMAGPSGNARIPLGKGITLVKKSKGKHVLANISLSAPKAKIPRRDVSRPIDQSEEDSDSDPNDFVFRHNEASADEDLRESSEDSESMSDDTETECSKQGKLSELQCEGMFDPIQLHKSKEFRLIESQDAFVLKNFNTYIKQEILNETVLKSDPVPVHDSLVVSETAIARCLI